jgi:hypothetical protein
MTLFHVFVRRRRYENKKRSSSSAGDLHEYCQLFRCCFSHSRLTPSNDNLSGIEARDFIEGSISLHDWASYWVRVKRFEEWRGDKILIPFTEKWRDHQDPWERERETDSLSTGIPSNSRHNVCCTIKGQSTNGISFLVFQDCYH